MFAGTTMLFTVAAEAAEEASKSEGLPQLDPNHFTGQLFWLTVTFVALLFVMSRIALPRVSDVLDERRDRIKRDLDAAGRLKAETDKALADYEKALADARSNASGIAKETREKLASETDAERQRVDAQIAGQPEAIDATADVLVAVVECIDVFLHPLLPDASRDLLIHRHGGCGDGRA